MSQQLRQLTGAHNALRRRAEVNDREVVRRSVPQQGHDVVAAAGQTQVVVRERLLDDTARTPAHRQRRESSHLGGALRSSRDRQVSVERPDSRTGPQCCGGTVGSRCGPRSGDANNDDVCLPRRKQTD